MDGMVALGVLGSSKIRSLLGSVRSLISSFVASILVWKTVDASIRSKHTSIMNQHLEVAQEREDSPRALTEVDVEFIPAHSEEVKMRSFFAKSSSR